MGEVMYRPHRGGFAEAMAEAVEYPTMTKLVEDFILRQDGVMLMYYGYDDRLKRETYILMSSQAGVLGYVWGK